MLLRLFLPLSAWGGFLLAMALTQTLLEFQAYHRLIPWLNFLFRLSCATTGILLLLRFLSFRIHRPWERVAAAYAQASGSEWKMRVVPGHGAFNFVVFSLSVAASLGAAVAGLPGNSLLAWLVASILDGLTLTLLWLWAARVCWLRSLRGRENLKSSLDDLRSRSTVKTQPGPREIPPPTFAHKALFGAAWSFGLFLLVGLGQLRLDSLSGIQTKMKVARCMEDAWSSAMQAYAKDGRGAAPDQGLECLPHGQTKVEGTWKQEEGGLGLTVWESGNADVFGDAVPGNQGIRLTPEGRLREMRRSFKNQ